MNAVDNTPPAWIRSIETLINKALRLDEETLYALAKLDGKVIAFQFTNTQLIVFLSPSIKGLAMNTFCANKPDVLIKGTPANFVMMLASAKKATTSLPTDMQITGDIGLGQDFQKIMQNIQIDLEEPLAKWVGDGAAYQLGKFFRGTGSFAINTSKTLALDMSEYLRFETEVLPDDLLVEAFCKDVDVLREDVDRVAQRFSALETRINNKRKATG